MLENYSFMVPDGWVWFHVTHVLYHCVLSVGILVWNAWAHCLLWQVLLPGLQVWGEKNKALNNVHLSKFLKCFDCLFQSTFPFTCCRILFGECPVWMMVKVLSWLRLLVIFLSLQQSAGIVNWCANEHHHLPNPCHLIIHLCSYHQYCVIWDTGSVIK